VGQSARLSEVVNSLTKIAVLSPLITFSLTKLIEWCVKSWFVLGVYDEVPQPPKKSLPRTSSCPLRVRLISWQSSVNHFVSPVCLLLFCSTHFGHSGGTSDTFIQYSFYMDFGSGAVLFTEPVEEDIFHGSF
jgi:hypothetical protein